jgi:biotin carboxyl carrier protein
MSFIPGTVLDILVKKDQDVRKGDDLLVLDAMKMQNNLKSNIDGTIKKILVNKGDKVSKGTILLELK